MPPRLRAPSSPASSAAPRSGGRRPPRSTPSSRSSRCPGIPAELSMADGSRSPTSHRTTWTRCSALGKQQYLLLSDDRFTSVDLSDRLGVGRRRGRQRVQPARTRERLARRDAGVLPAARSRRGLGPGAQHAGGRSRPLTSRARRGPGTGRLGTHAARRATGPVGPRRPRVQSFPVAGPDGTAAELDWMAEGASAPSASEPGHVANPEFLAAGTPDGARPAGVRDGQEQDVLRRRWRGSATTSCCSPPRPRRRVPGAGLAGRHAGPVPRQRVHRPPAAGTSRPAGPRTPSASRGAR